MYPEKNEQHGRASRVTEWYAGRSVLVTGATGFLGKAIVEKLLRSCLDIATIYLLVRPKRGQDPYQRLETYVSDPVFNRLREERPDFARHLSVVSGDLSEPTLIPAEDEVLALRRDVSVVFHCGASVRFDDSLRAAVVTNLVGTKHALQLAEGLPHLEAFVYVSTAFCHSNQPVLEEKLYPAEANPEKVMDMVSWMDDDLLATAAHKLLGELPNTYVFTKNLSEELVASYGSKLPVLIVRPSIVVPAWKEPVPGWLDNKNGPIGISIASGKGVLRSIHCRSDVQTDIMPVDCTANAIIALVWHLAGNRSSSPYVCNVTNGCDNRITWKSIHDMLFQLSLTEIAIEPGLWYPSLSMTTSYGLHRLQTMLFQLIPAYVIDFLLALIGRKPFMVNIQHRMVTGIRMYAYYMLNEWLFVNEKLHSLAESMLPEEREIFYFDVRPLDWYDFCRNAIVGGKIYLLKEDMANVDKARRNLIRMYYLDRAVKTIFYGLLIWFLYYWSETILENLEFVLEKLITLVCGAPFLRVFADEVSTPMEIVT